MPDRDVHRKAIGRWVVQALHLHSEPLGRYGLAEELRAHAFFRWGFHWKHATADRRLREGINAAIDDGAPILTCPGGGYKLASTREELARIVAQHRRRGAKCYRRAARLERAWFEGEAEQPDLPLVAAGGGR